MARDNCRLCGGVIERGAANCPHCGARLGFTVSRVWVLTFFVMGIVIGLLLLILQGGLLPFWSGMSLSPDITKETQQQSESSKARVAAPPPSRPGNDSVGPLPAVSTAKLVAAPMRCDREAARAVHEKASELAMISLQAGVLQLRLGSAWEYYSPGHRRGFVEAFAEADRCLQEGDARPIRFSFRGSEVASVDTAGAVEMQ
jgi:hypothetical protein